MGISFDAAAVRSAGGLENFLLGLDSAVQEYAAKSGTLSETIYGQLFGSAEALRLLGSLTGEQRETFSANIGAMADSAGAMDAAFDQMASTGNAQSAMFGNIVNGMTGWIGSMASAIAPHAELVANVGSSIASITQLCVALKTVSAALTAANIKAAALAVTSKAVAAASAVWKGVQAALNIVLSANPIGIVVMAIAALVAGIIYAYNNCEEFREICDKVWAVIKDVAVAVWDWLVKAFEDCSSAIKKAWEWVKEFFGIGDDGPTQEQTAALEANTAATDDNAEAKARAAREAMAVKEANDWQTMSYAQLGEAIERQKVKVAQLAGTTSKEAASEAALLRQMCILSIGRIRHLTGIDLMCIHDNPAGLGLTENPGQANHRKYFTVNHITEHISCTNRWKLINISHQNQTHVRRDCFHQRIHQNNINHRTLIHNQNITLKRSFLIFLIAFRRFKF